MYFNNRDKKPINPGRTDADSWIDRTLTVNPAQSQSRACIPGL